MDAARDALWFPLQKSSGGATNEYLATEPRVPKGEVWVITHIAVEDETSACTSVRIGRGTQQRPRWLQEQPAPQAGQLYTEENEHHLGEGEQLVVRFTGSTSGDVLVANVEGRRER